MTIARRTTRWIAAALAACSLLLGLAFVTPPAEAKDLQSPVQVSDDITRLHVNKLDSDTHDYVQGATMAIIEKDTGVVVDEWVTGSGTHENEKGLDVDKVYILREMKAPNGFTKAADTEFVVNATEGTGITILSGPDAELTESYKVNLYDRPVGSENVQTVVRQGNGGSDTPVNRVSDNSTVVAPKTGDETPLELILGLVCVGIVGIVALQVYKRRLA